MDHILRALPSVLSFLGLIAVGLFPHWLYAAVARRRWGVTDTDTIRVIMTRYRLPASAPESERALQTLLWLFKRVGVVFLIAGSGLLGAGLFYDHSLLGW